MADHGPVKVRQANIDRLIELYKSTYKKITNEIVDSTEAGKIQRARVLGRINTELESLGVDVNAYVKKEIPQYYSDGANSAIQDLRKMGVDISKPTGQAAINKEAIAALVDDSALSFAESLRGVGRSAQRKVSDVLKQQINAGIAQGKLLGETRKTIAKGVASQLSEDGLGALTDAGGKTWTFEAYANMLARTKAVEARNQGLANRMLQNGYDLVQVTDHNSEHQACADWEGEILSISGDTEGELPGGFEVAGTLQEAIEAGLFHPNCEHAINVLQPKLAAITKAYENPFNKE